VSRQLAGAAAARHDGEPGQALGRAWCWLASQARIGSLVGSRPWPVASPSRSASACPFADLGTLGSPVDAGEGVAPALGLGLGAPRRIARGSGGFSRRLAESIAGQRVVGAVDDCRRALRARSSRRSDRRDWRWPKRPSPSGRLPPPRPSSPSTRCRSRSAAAGRSGRGLRAARSSTVRRAIRDELNGGQVGCTALPGARSRVASPSKYPAPPRTQAAGRGPIARRVKSGLSLPKARGRARLRGGVRVASPAAPRPSREGLEPVRRERHPAGAGSVWDGRRRVRRTGI